MRMCSLCYCTCMKAQMLVEVMPLTCTPAVACLRKSVKKFGRHVLTCEWGVAQVAVVAGLFDKVDPAPFNRDSKSSDVSAAGGGGYGTPLSRSRLPEGAVSGDEQAIRDARKYLDEQQQTGGATNPDSDFTPQTNTLLDPYGKEPNKR